MDFFPFPHMTLKNVARSTKRTSLPQKSNNNTRHCPSSHCHNLLAVLVSGPISNFHICIDRKIKSPTEKDWSALFAVVVTG
jgi:hypothetical protein